MHGALWDPVKDVECRPWMMISPLGQGQDKIRKVASEKCPVSGTDRSEDGEGKDLKSTAPPQDTRGPRITY